MSTITRMGIIASINPNPYAGQSHVPVLMSWEQKVRQKYGVAINALSEVIQLKVCDTIDNLLHMLPRSQVENFFVTRAPLSSEELLLLYPGLKPENYLEFIQDLLDNAISASNDPREVADASKDMTPVPHIGRAHHVLYPKSHEELRKIILLLNHYKIPCTFRAGGTNLTGCAIPLDGVVISFKELKLDSGDLYDVNLANRSVKVVPGIPTKDLNDVLRKEYSSQLRFDPVCMMGASSGINCNVGGNVAMDASGPSGMQNGPTSHSVIGFNAIRGDGVQVYYQTGPVGRGPGTHKNVAGLKDGFLVIGSEGILAGLTSVSLRLKERVEHTLDLICLFNSMQQASEAIAAFCLHEIWPNKLELMSDICVTETVETLQISLPPELSSLGKTHKAKLIVTFEGGADFDPHVSARKIDVLMANFQGSKVVHDDAEHKLSNFAWDIRAKVFSAVTKIAPLKASDDVVVPLDKLGELMEWLPTLAEDLHIKITAAGHAGDGNLHVQFYHYPLEDKNAEELWRKTLEFARFMVFLKVLSFDGSITGEHGVGTKKRDYLPLQIDPFTLQNQMEIKLSNDPNLILNPGVMFHLRDLLELKERRGIKL